MPTLTTLVAFNGDNGNLPIGGLVNDAAGNLFGATEQGGAAGDGTVFEIAKTANGYANTPTTLVSFSGADGSYPYCNLITDAAGDLFGTTLVGGVYNKGTVFEIEKTAGGYASAVTTLVNFNGADGSGPIAGLTTDATGDLFGATAYGGAGGSGTVFEVAKTAEGYSSVPTTLASFDGANGSYLAGGLITDTAGDLLGTTQQGGASGDGTVFEIAKTTDGYASAPTTLFSFNGANGSNPTGGLVADRAGNLFGTTDLGGVDGYGTVFEIAKTADGYANEPTTLVSFDGSDEKYPVFNLIIDGAGDLFGVTNLSGSYNGTVFEIAKTADGYANTVTTVVGFHGNDGSGPCGQLVADSAGNLLGVTELGGDNNGTVFEISGSGFVGASKTFNFTLRADNFHGGSENDTFIATTGTLSNGDVAVGGTGTNVLNLIGGGTFDLRAPTTFSGIPTVNAQEGQVAYSSGSVTSPNTRQQIFLRSGVNLTVNVAADPSADAANPNTPGIVIHGAADADVINLGPGADEVFVGSAAETVDGGSGNALISVTAAQVGATLDGGTGKSTLGLNGGGVVTLGANITRFASVDLGGPPSGQTQPTWTFTANAIQGLKISDASGGADVITVGDASQLVATANGTYRIKLTASTAGALIWANSGSDLVEVTGGGTVALNKADHGVSTVQLDQATVLTVGGGVGLVLGSAGTDTINAGGANETLTGGGGADTLVGFTGGGDTFKDTAAHLNGDTIRNFGAKGDRIDVTDIAYPGWKPTFIEDKSGAFGILTLADSTHTAKVVLFGQFVAANFHVTGDGGTGEVITYSATAAAALPAGAMASIGASHSGSGAATPFALQNGMSHHPSLAHFA